MPSQSVEPPSTTRVRSAAAQRSARTPHHRTQARRHVRARQIARRRAVLLCLALVSLIAGALVGQPGAAKHDALSGVKVSAGHRADASGATGANAYINPLRAASKLESGRIDMGVDYAGSGPVLALGDGRITFESNTDSGPSSCYGTTCWPVGGIVVYRLSDGPFAGKYVYVAENITVHVSFGQIVRAGQQIATMHDRYPDVETGWASGNGPETLAIADRHQCTCGDPGGWSTIEGRNFDRLMISLGAPSGDLQPNVPTQTLPAGWPEIPGQHGATPPKSSRPLPEGSTQR